MSTETIFMAIRSVDGPTVTLDGTLIRHFGVSCAKCRENYDVWGPAPELEKSLRQDRENWLTEHLPNVCPFHKHSFPVPSPDPD
jgi:hypothetical protein